MDAGLPAHGGGGTGPAGGAPADDTEAAASPSGPARPAATHPAPPLQQAAPALPGGTAETKAASPMEVEPAHAEPGVSPGGGGAQDTAPQNDAGGNTSQGDVCYTSGTAVPEAPLILSPAAGALPTGPAVEPEAWPELGGPPAPGGRRRRAPKTKKKSPSVARQHAAAAPASPQQAPVAEAPPSRGAAAAADPGEPKPPPPLLTTSAQAGRPAPTRAVSPAPALATAHHPRGCRLRRL